MPVFADSAYWVARLDRRDALHARSIEVGRQLGTVRILTSDLVLAEVLNFFARSGPVGRQQAAQMVLAIEVHPLFEIVRHDAAASRRALAVYADRPDQSWSFTDCASLVIMQDRAVTDVLTHDHHFEQMGFRALLRG